ncbi:hypothetical protein VPH35_068851 [Triticum aestivum]
MSVDMYENIKCNINIIDIEILKLMWPRSKQRKKLIMMEIPSVFGPGDRSITLYEGINHHPDPDSIFRSKTVAQLGCGNGWISIALAEKWCPSKVYGLDINPRAIKIAWINLYLNALDDDGLPIYDREGKTLLNRIELDSIVGCIPQILKPNPEAMSKIITENLSKEFLYSLSSYYALQGFVEDQFGLGLIARAVEEGMTVIKPTGTMIFNVGGQPGQGVCECLFLRRGFRITKLWQTKIMQAANTDISALVEFEKNSPHRFEFFMGSVGDQPVSARTALAYMESGGHISHALSVYSCQLRQPNQVKKLTEILKNVFHEVSRSLDLSFADDSTAQEKITFLVYLASFLNATKPNPCQPPAGCLNFRKLVAEFMKSYHHIPLNPDNFVVFPSRAVAVENYLRLFSPALAIVDEHLTRHLPMQWLGYSEIEGRIDCNNAEGVITVIEAPRQSDLLIELVRKLKPQVVVTSIAQFEAITSAAFSNILSATEDVGCRLFLDISENLEWSCLPSSNGVLKYLIGNTLPSHAFCEGDLYTISYHLAWNSIRTSVYSDLEVAFAISEDASVCKALSQRIELLEGNTSVISQQYYGSLFHELLAFQIGDRHQHAHQRQAAEKIPEKMIQFSNSAMSTLKEADFFTPDSKDSSVIHMDLDRSFLPVPSPLGGSILASFARRNVMDFETDVRSSIEQLVGDNYGFPGDSCPDVTFNNRSCGFSKEIIYGSTCLTLLNKLVLCCMREQGAFLFPMGTNGHYVSAAKFMNAKTLTIPTNVRSGFKIEPTALRAALDDAYENENVWPWVYIFGPTVNPSGSLYSDDEIKDLLSICAEHGARVVIDTSSSGLEFETGDGRSLWNLDSFSYNIASCLALRVFMLGELSLQLTMSGFDFGFMIYIDPSLIKHMLTSLSQPHRTLKYTSRKLLCLKNKRDQRFSDLIEEQKETLKHRADKLTKTLESCGWDVVGCHGGISMLAKPTAYIGKSFKIDTFEGELDGCNIREALLRSTGLCISSSKWTGIPDYCRFSFAPESSEFDQAMDCITRFRELVLGDNAQMNVNSS